MFSFSYQTYTPVYPSPAAAGSGLNSGLQTFYHMYYAMTLQLGTVSHSCPPRQVGLASLLLETGERKGMLFSNKLSNGRRGEGGSETCKGLFGGKFCFAGI